MGYEDFRQKDFAKARHIKAVASTFDTRVLDVRLFDERTKVHSIRFLRQQLSPGLKRIFRYFAKICIVFVGDLGFFEISNVF